MRRSLQTFAATLAFSFLGAVRVFALPIVNVSVEPLALLVREICADQCETNSLVPRGASEHSWQPGPKDMLRAKEALASVSVGLGFDDAWFKKIGVIPNSLLRLGPQLSPMAWWSDDMSDKKKTDLHGSSNGPGKASAVHEHDDHSDHDDHAATDDPHVWTDAGRMAKAADLIASHLAVTIPSGAPNFVRRAKEISERLTKLQIDTDLRRKGWRTRPVVMFHDTAGYFARRFNLPVLSIAAGSAGHDHSARMIANVSKRFKGVNVAAVMVERDDGAAKSLARELKTRVKIVDFAAGQSYQRWDDWYLQLVAAWEDVLK